ncbi:putative chromatin regulator PHD family [Helianthus anomalus]
MDETSTTPFVGSKRAFEDEIGTDFVHKKVKLAGDLKKVAEIVLVLAAMGRMRGGRGPTAAEAEMMVEARGRLVEVCEEFAPKDVFCRDVFGTVVEDLGFGGVREVKVGVLSVSIKQKLELAKQKMEKSEAFPLHSATYIPHAVQTVPSGEADHAPVSSRSFQNISSVVHASPNSDSRTLPYQLPTSEVRPVGPNVLTGSHLGRCSIASPIDHMTNVNHHKQHQTNFVQPPAANTHNEVAKIVQKVLQSHMPDHHTWNPPSRDYMNKPLTCQTCKSMINEVDTLLICDACEKGYHLRCLQCNPKSIFVDECREWHCAKCLAISNGKPLPLKYGRVMRNVNTPKRPTSSSGGQPSLEKKVTSSDENFNQRLMSANGDSVSQTSTTQNGIKFDSNSKGENGKTEEVVEKGNIVKKSENCTTVRENEGSLPSSVQDVEWVGGVINEIDGKMYFGSCCINGTTYKLQDYAMFSFTGNLMLNKLQSMWEDNKTNEKWVTVTRCFFPDDLPEGVGRPCAPESSEVYESNHETTLAAGMIHGPCEVLPPHKFSEETVIQAHSQTNAFDKPKRVFLCKWFYDEKKRLFRDVTC